MLRVELYLITLLGCLLSTSVLARSCEDVLNQLKKEPNFTLVMQGEMHSNFQYGEDTQISVSISCMQPEPDAMISWDGLEPSAQYYELVGRVGTLITGRNADDVIQAAKKCRSLALKDPSELASIDGQKMGVECQAFTRDGGATGINIYPQ